MQMKRVRKKRNMSKKRRNRKKSLDRKKRKINITFTPPTIQASIASAFSQ
jgi:hypothetical protein